MTKTITTRTKAAAPAMLSYDKAIWRGRVLLFTGVIAHVPNATRETCCEESPNDSSSSLFAACSSSIAAMRSR
jgi:hypothetical protein